MRGLTLNENKPNKNTGLSEHLAIDMMSVNQEKQGYSELFLLFPFTRVVLEPNTITFHDMKQKPIILAYEIS